MENQGFSEWSANLIGDMALIQDTGVRATHPLLLRLDEARRGVEGYDVWRRFSQGISTQYLDIGVRTIIIEFRDANKGRPLQELIHKVKSGFKVITTVTFRQHKDQKRGVLALTFKEPAR